MVALVKVGQFASRAQKPGTVKISTRHPGAVEAFALKVYKEKGATPALKALVRANVEMHKK